VGIGKLDSFTPYGGTTKVCKKVERWTENVQDIVGLGFEFYVFCITSVRKSAFFPNPCQ
jgi:hypothetical protein